MSDISHIDPPPSRRRASLLRQDGRRVRLHRDPGLATPQSDPARPILIRKVGVVTLDPEMGEIAGGDILLAGGRIRAVGRDLHAPHAASIDGEGLIAMPGLALGCAFGWQGLWPDGPPTRDTRALRRLAAAASPPEHAAAAARFGAAALASGVTRLLDHVDVQSTPAAALAHAEGLIGSGVAGWFCWSLDDVVRRPSRSSWRWALLERLRRERFADDRAALRLSASLAVTVDDVAEVEAVVWRLRLLGIGLIVLRLADGGDASIAAMTARAILGPDVLVDHLGPLSDATLERIAASGAATCADTLSRHPVALASRAWAARAAGVRTVLSATEPFWRGQGGFSAMRTAYWEMYGQADGAAEASTWTAADVIAQAVDGGAVLAPPARETGRLTPGASGDLVLVRSCDQSGQPTKDFAGRAPLADQIALLCPRVRVEAVFVSGVQRATSGPQDAS